MMDINLKGQDQIDFLQYPYLFYVPYGSKGKRMILDLCQMYKKTKAELERDFCEDELEYLNSILTNVNISSPINKNEVISRVKASPYTKDFSKKIKKLSLFEVYTLTLMAAGLVFEKNNSHML